LRRRSAWRSIHLSVRVAAAAATALQTACGGDASAIILHKTIAEIDDFYITSGIVAVTDLSQVDQALKDMISA
jgi:hypothetical protein